MLTAQRHRVIVSNHNSHVVDPGVLREDVADLLCELERQADRAVRAERKFGDAVLEIRRLRAILAGKD